MKQKTKLDDPAIKKKIETDLIELYANRLRSTPIPATLVTILIVAVFWGEIPNVNFYVWLSLIGVIYIAILPGTFTIIQKLPNKLDLLYRYRFLIVLMTFIAGSAWGSSAYFLFVPDSEFYQVVLLAFILAIASTSGVVMIENRTNFIALVIPMLTPFIIMLLLSSNYVFWLLAYGTFQHMVVLIYAQNINNNTLKNTLFLQYCLAEQKQIAEDAKLAQTQLFAAASHDLRQPIHAQGLLVATLKKRSNQAETSRILGVLENSMDGMQTLLNSILDFSKLDAGALEPEINAFRIQPLFDQLFLDYEALANDKNLKFMVRAAPVTVVSDKLLIERILRNLISNAIRYTDCGAVLVTARRRDRNLYIEVKDSGPGIAEHEQKVIFQDFKQLGTKKIKQSPGLGLGLAIVKRLTTLLNHDLTLRSAPGKGSTFSLTVPLAQTDVSSGELSTPRPETPTIDLNGRRILVVDDNLTILESMRELFNDWGCLVISCTSGEAVFKKIQDHSYTPELAIMDYRLEGETGIEILDKMKSILNIDIPSIIITGDTAADKLHEFQNARCIVLHKPIKPDVLRAYTEKLLGSPHRST